MTAFVINDTLLLNKDAEFPNVNPISHNSIDYSLSQEYWYERK